MPTSNQPTPDFLKAMTFDELRDYRAEVAASLAEQKTALTEVDTVIADRCNDTLCAALLNSGKTHGSVTIPLTAGTRATGKLDQKVEWDQDKLRALAALMDWDTVQHFFKITFSVPESVYKAMPPDDPRKAALVAARTTKLSPLKVALEKVAG